MIQNEGPGMEEEDLSHGGNSSSSSELRGGAASKNQVTHSEPREQRTTTDSVLSGAIKNQQAEPILELDRARSSKPVWNQLAFSTYYIYSVTLQDL